MERNQRQMWKNVENNVETDVESLHQMWKDDAKVQKESQTSEKIDVSELLSAANTLTNPLYKKPKKPKMEL